MKANVVIDDKVYLRDIINWSTENGSCSVWHKHRTIQVPAQNVMGLVEHSGFRKHLEYIKAINVNKQIYKLQQEIVSLTASRVALKQKISEIEQPPITIDQLCMINPMMRFIIINEEQRFRFVFENSYTSSGSHSSLSDDYEKVKGKGYPVSGGFYIHNFHNSAIEQLSIILYGASSYFRRPTDKEFEGAIEHYNNTKKQGSRGIQFVVKPIDWDMSLL